MRLFIKIYYKLLANRKTKRNTLTNIKLKLTQILKKKNLLNLFLKNLPQCCFIKVTPFSVSVLLMTKPVMSVFLPGYLQLLSPNPYTYFGNSWVFPYCSYSFQEIYSSIYEYFYLGISCVRKSNHNNKAPNQDSPFLLVVTNLKDP